MYFFTPVPRYGGDTDIYLTGLNFWDGPHAGVLDAVVVLPHLDPEEAHLAPVGAPAVATDPEPLPGGIVAAPAHQAHLPTTLVIIWGTMDFLVYCKCTKWMVVCNQCAGG